MYPYSEFAAGLYDLPVLTEEAIPGPGDWAIAPGIQFGTLFVQMTPPTHQPQLQVTEVAWAGVDPGDGETNLSTVGSTATIFPERNHPVGKPNSQVHDKVNVTVTINPAVPAGKTATVHGKLYDPDNTQTGAADPNDPDPNTTLPVDNRKSGGDLGGQSLGITPGTFALTYGAGDTTQSQELEITKPQPGNNFIVGAHQQPTVANELRFRDDGVSLFYRSPATGSEYDVRPSHRSAMLEVWRTLWVESDHMGAPGDNDGPFNGDPGADDDPRFTPSDPTIAALTALLEPAYVRVQTLPAEHDTRNTTDFEHYQGSTSVYPGVKDVSSSKYYWDVHMLGAYEWSMALDNDPDAQDWLAGFSEASDDGTNFVLEETVRDLWEQEPPELPELPGMVPHATGLDRVSAHEALHRFFGWHKTLPDGSGLDLEHPSNQGIMDGTTLMTAESVELTDIQIRFVQAKDHPK